MYAANYISNWADVVAHVLKEYPKEACGYVTLDNVFVPCPNVAEDPLTTFVLPRVTEPYKCILHSHAYDPTNPPDLDPRTPSKIDLAQQAATDVEWALVVTEGQNVTPPFFWGDYSHRPPLMDREFIHSLQDCLSFMCDWQYQDSGLKLPAFPRDPDWFENGEDHMEEQFEAWGFIDVTDQPEQRGDVVFFKIRSEVVNHLGVVTEPGLVVHHLLGRFPVEENVYQTWHKYITRRIRHRTHLK